jgi:hypothetical protein
MAADKKVDQIMRMRSTTYLHYVPFISITADERFYFVARFENHSLKKEGLKRGYFFHLQIFPIR